MRNLASQYTTMSAESPRKSSRQGGHIVAPQSVSDRSIIDSVAGFINEVVPQAYTSAPVGEGKEAITWARFEYGDINDPALYPDSADDRNSSPPLLLVLGYGSGVQVWAIPASGEATEVLSWRQGVVRTLRILPTPGSDACTPDTFSHKRPLVAMCDSAGGPSPQFCSLSFISLRGGDQVKSIKFKNPVSDVLANRRSVVVTFPERIAVFDASTLEDRLTVTTCYPCPGPNPNPVALGSRWLAYSERRLMPARRSSGGTEGDGVQSYTATVLHAAKSFGKGLRELGETVASSLTGGGAGMGLQRGMVGGIGGPVAGQQGGNMLSGNADIIQPGVVTILDAQGALTSRREEESRSGDSLIGGSTSSDNIIAHFMAHSEPIVALAFDPSGMLLLTADKRGHDFHVFRIHPHPGGPFLAAIHHLYILHRGDTTAKVQDIAFAADSRWVAVSTLRGTTHVFPITPYGGPVGIRTHATPHVVNRLSRFHRSAGLTADGRNSPIPTPVSEAVSTPPPIPYPNPRLPPYSHPTVISPLAQIRQPTTHTLLSTPTSINPTSHQPYHRNPSMRSLGRTQSSSDDGLPGGGIPLRVTACFAPPRAWLIESPTLPRETSAKAHKRAVDSLFVMACHGNLIEYDLQPRHAAGIPKEKVCDDTAIELDVRPKAQWMLLRPPHSSELQPPLSPTNPLMVVPDRLPTPSSCESREDDSDSDERWLSQVEIVTHAGPHRRLWMGPQFTFKTYNSAVSGVPLSLLELEAVEVGVGSGSRPARSNPVNMPISSGSRPVVPVLIESGSGSSYEQSPRLLEAYGTDGAESDGSAGPGETQLREDLADAMMESPGIPTHDTGGSQSLASYEDLSSSSFSSASRASFDARCSPSPSYGAENVLVFPGDSSGSV
ncbi:breast carcinoma-amplified sequence 3 homolog isoform X3 [Cryptotermes secundus]|uniref:breast carcinoma-amplified sequence 3 homolog isoform X3 n=1 Tax=Cryptotermes secundus TaxID=105785 RepID=UPI001454BBBD|nr:breast carcinoma-amplified sequence 3 homolog isoform X3 [Cryptotermes secundus]